MFRKSVNAVKGLVRLTKKLQDKTAKAKAAAAKKAPAKKKAVRKKSAKGRK
ncbi:MAG: hypothetical protein HN650_18275 [Rhodospirillaceae bacterium]|nr:hypothetical protein [Rhodospirillaceae bacterium]